MKSESQQRLGWDADVMHRADGHIDGSCFRDATFIFFLGMGVSQPPKGGFGRYVYIYITVVSYLLQVVLAIALLQPSNSYR